MDDTRILLAHGNGGRLMRELITDVYARHLGNPLLDTDADAVTLPHADGELMVTTDGFTVEPLEFPGGDIGSLAVHGVVNDLAVAGAEPLYFTVSALIEEGLEIGALDRYISSFVRAARQNHVVVVAGDTKVVRRGEGSGSGGRSRQCGDAGARAVRSLGRTAFRFGLGAAADARRTRFSRSQVHARPDAWRARHGGPRNRTRQRPQRDARPERGTAAPGSRICL